MLDRIMALHGGKIAYAHKVVNVYEFDLLSEGPDGRFIVKILQKPNNKYTCRVSHKVIPSLSGKPYHPMFEEYDSEEAALTAALTKGLEAFSLDDIGAEWIENTNF